MYTVSTLGSRGLVVYTKDHQFRYKSEKDWRKDNACAPLTGANGVVTKIKDSVFVDLDQLTGLAAPQSEPAPNPPSNQPVDGTSIIFKEEGRYYQIPLDGLDRLPEGAEGDAGVVVKRGAVVATIPANIIPSGTYCVLVNLSSLK